MAPPPALAAAPAATAPPKDSADVAYTSAAKAFLKIYRDSGMLGAAVEVDACYKRAGVTFRFSCIALDSMAYVMTEVWAKNGYPSPMESLEYPAYDARVRKQLRYAGMRDDKQMDAYINALVQRCSVALALESERSRTQ